MMMPNSPAEGPIRSHAERQGLPSHRWWDEAAPIVRELLLQQQDIRKPPETLNRQLHPLLDGFRATGAVSFKLDLPAQIYEEIRRHLGMFPVYPSHHVYSGPLIQRPLAETRSAANFGCYGMDTIIKAPHLLAIANLDPLLDFVEEILGCTPTLYSVHAWWSFPQLSPASLNSQFFHRDTDDWRFVTVFLYLTDVGPEDGPHQYILGSQTLNGTRQLVEQAAARGLDTRNFDAGQSFISYFHDRFSGDCEALFPNAIASFMGAQGTVLVANTVGIHRGLLPRRSPRLIFWARFGLGPNTNSADLEQGPVSHRLVSALQWNSARTRYINRLLVS